MLRKGQERWHFESKLEPVGPPMLNRKEILIAVTDRLVVLDVRSGEVKGDYPLPGIATAPALFKNILLYGTREGEVVTFESWSGKVRKKTKVGEHAISTPLVHAGSLVYGAADEVLFAVDAHQGKVAWTITAKAPFQQPAIADKCVYVGAGTRFFCFK